MQRSSTTQAQATMPATHAHDCQTCSASELFRWQKYNYLDFPRLQRTSRYFPSSKLRNLFVDDFKALTVPPPKVIRHVLTTKHRTRQCTRSRPCCHGLPCPRWAL